jgi:hypothetical protein
MERVGLLGIQIQGLPPDRFGLRVLADRVEAGRG